MTTRIRSAIRSNWTRTIGVLALLLLLGGTGLYAAQAVWRYLNSLQGKLAALTQTPPTAAGKPTPATAPAQYRLKVTPYYDAQAYQVSVGKFSPGLAACATGKLRKTILAMRAEWTTLPAEAMYVAAIRLYDLDEKDDATYWFYSAQHRARLIRMLAVANPGAASGDALATLDQACVEFDRQAGGFINGHAFGDPENLAGILAKVREASQSLPDLRQAYPELKFLPDPSWPAANDAILGGWSALAGFVRDHRDTILDLRQFTKTHGAD